MDMSSWWRLIEDSLGRGGALAWVLAVAISWTLAMLVKASVKLAAGRLRGWTALKSTNLSEWFASSFAATKTWTVFIWILYLLMPLLETSAPARKTASHVAVVATMLQFGFWGFAAIRFWRDHIIKKRVETDLSSAATVSLMGAVLQGALVIVLVLMGLSNMGIDIAALIAGLGVGGIAIALAAQNILGDLLASLSIVLDKPFIVGDFLVVGDEKGTVEHIGIKTTRLRSLSGEQLVFSNKDLLESRIRNFKRMWERRAVQRVGVTYSTPIEKIEAIPGWVKGFVEKHPKLRFDRCHFANYGPSSLDFEFVFWVSDPEFNVYMDLQEKVLIDIYRKFSAERIEFAFPTQTIHIAPGAKL
jgi:small-conductance mechanosensitive channel